MTMWYLRYCEGTSKGGGSSFLYLSLFMYLSSMMFAEHCDLIKDILLTFDLYFYCYKIRYSAKVLGFKYIYIYIYYGLQQYIKLHKIPGIYAFNGARKYENLSVARKLITKQSTTLASREKQRPSIPFTK